MSEAFTKAAKAVAKKRTSDVLCFVGGIWEPRDNEVYNLTKSPQAKSLFVVLNTPGGSPDAAYRIGRCLQRRYEKIILLVHDTCKSAGTLLALAAHELVMEDGSQLGPLDMQVLDKEEVGELSSGLTLSQSLTVLRQEAFTCMKETFEKLRWNSPFNFSTKLAAQVASEMAIGLFRSVYEQLDPSRLGENERAMLIGQLYGERLTTENIKERSLAKLLKAYPSHGFVIDVDEARILFNSVTFPSVEDVELLKALDEEAGEPSRTYAEAFVKFVPMEAAKETAEKDLQNEEPRHDKTNSGGEAEVGPLVRHSSASDASDGKQERTAKGENSTRRVHPTLAPPS